MATPTATAGYLVESRSGVVAPLASRTAVPLHARLEVDPARAQAPIAELVVAPFTGYGFPREDFVGEVELHLEQDRITRVLFRAPRRPRSPGSGAATAGRGACGRSPACCRPPA